MKPDCLHESDLILLHYGETPEGATPAAAAAHLSACSACRTRLERVAADLDRIPAVADPDPVVATRIAARVNERLHEKRRWLPVAGAAVAGTLALAMAVVVWLPANQQPATNDQRLVTSIQQPAAHSELQFVGPPRPTTHQATLDLELLDQLDMLEELETLQALEGV